MHYFVKLFLDWFAGWLKAHPNSRLSRTMLKRRGPRQDVPHMNRIERLRSALVFLLWGLFFLGLWFGAGYLIFALKLPDPDNPAVMVSFVSLAIFAGIGLIAGFYLMVRVIV